MPRGRTRGVAVGSRDRDDVVVDVTLAHQRNRRVVDLGRSTGGVHVGQTERTVAVENVALVGFVHDSSRSVDPTRVRHEGHTLGLLRRGHQIVVATADHLDGGSHGLDDVVSGASSSGKRSAGRTDTK